LAQVGKEHLNNIFGDGELQKDATISKMEIVQQESRLSVTRNKEFLESMMVYL
jgi:hypothetical protein